MSRRAFVQRGVAATAAVFLAGACGDGEIGGVLNPDSGDGTPPPVPGGPGGLVVALVDFPALGVVGGTARVDGGGATPIGVSRTGPSSFVAVSMICPHAGFKPIEIRSTGYRCPNHGATFADDGQWISGQATSNLERYAVAYDPATESLTIT